LAALRLRKGEASASITAIMRHAIAVAAILSCFLVSEAKAYVSGNELWVACEAAEGKGSVMDAACGMYVLGTVDTVRVLHDSKQITYYCIPDNVTNGQLVDVVKLYLRNHPENRQYAGPTLIMMALKEKFPCN
jgi:Rap1a immunity proteins